ncbi:uncharacterized protein GLRG_11717 [Colletotrichum graminicola M1.001]|uniref:Uncharacterized protein n=1 Tax=Colletotrichum graminicola (strain M1.001 / M2 / FGSC 10212) TaxID=645133 RepID=E3R0E6_COLGM|nr:uncharacterized protein GLRG_11717 [Colletotrichum graminicola M1.001]EFQ36584.1 hypothetical protein GLRG_11717 [Colletotrichum graminicola M1.001]
MLNAKKPGMPITAMAKTTHAIFLESLAQFSHSLEQLCDVTADCFIATRGSDDLKSLYARQVALVSGNSHEISISDIENVLEIYSDLWDEAVGLFGENLYEAMTVEWYRIRAMEWLSYDGFEHSCERYIRRIQTKNGCHWHDWDPEYLNDVAYMLRYLAQFHEDADNFDSCIFYSEECIRMLNYLVEKHGSFAGYRPRAVEVQLELIEVLSKLGRLQEASEVRLNVAGSGYLREVVDNDVECESLEI